MHVEPLPLLSRVTTIGLIAFGMIYPATASSSFLSTLVVAAKHDSHAKKGKAAHGKKKGSKKHPTPPPASPLLPVLAGTAQMTPSSQPASVAAPQSVSPIMADADTSGEIQEADE